MSLIPAIATNNNDVPVFAGLQVFGLLSSFSVVEVVAANAGGPAAIAAFLGVDPATIAYGPDPGGHAWGLAGALVGPSSDAVAAMEAALLALAGVSSTLGVPTGLRYPSDFQYLGSCYFVASEFVPSGAGIVAVGGGMWSLSYLVVFRQIGGGIF